MEIGGTYPMLYAFFDEAGRLRRDAVARQVDASIACGAAGIAVLGLGTEVQKLGREERRSLVEWTIEAVHSRVPVAVTVADASGRTVISSISAADGRFRVSLAPGTYTLLARGPNQPQLLRPVAVSVEAGRYADLRLFLDTGIR